VTDTVDKVQQPEVTTTLANSQEALDSFVELFDITLPGYDPGTGDGNYFLFSGLNNEGTDKIEFRNNQYSAIPIQITGIEVASSGAIARPTLTIANIPVLSKTIDDKEITLHNIRDPSIRASGSNLIDGSLNVEFETNDDLIGTKVVYRQAFLSDCNTGSATPNEFPPQVYYIDRIASESNIFVIFELASPMDVERAKIPARNVIGQYCPWQYQGRELGFGGGCTWRYTESEQHSFFRSDDTKITEALTEWSSTHNSGNGYTKGNIVKTTETTGPEVNAGSFVIGQLYKIVTTGTTNFQSIGSSSNAVNTIFRATAAGSGSGKAQEISNQVQIWEALFDNTGKDPRHHRKYWKRIDLCGKSLNSCKIRFQGNASSDDLDSAVPLPFGGFPGSKKFK